MEKRYSVWDRETHQYLATGAYSESKEEAINAVLGLISSDTDEDWKTINNMSIEQKEEMLSTQWNYIIEEVFI